MSGSSAEQKERPGGPKKGDGQAEPGWGDKYGNPDRGATGDFDGGPVKKTRKFIYKKRPGGSLPGDGTAEPGWGDEYGNPERGAVGDFGLEMSSGVWVDEHGNHLPDPGDSMANFGGTGWDDGNLGMGDFGSTGWDDGNVGMGDFGGTGWDDKNLGMGDFDDFRTKETQEERNKKRHIMGIEVNRDK